jgi:serine phosphatase RsbU (regulator of sigma subunit)
MQTKYESVQKEKEIELLAKDNQLKEVENEKQRTTILYMIAGLVIILIFSLLLLRLFRQKQAANRVLVKQNIEIAQQKEEIQTQRDEIEAQRDEIEAQRDLVTVQKEELEEIHGELKSSIRYAKRIQNATLPSQEIMKNCPGEHFVIFRPRDIVSGDFFWAVKVREWFLFCVADCTGHGVPGAFMSMLGITLLNEIVRRDEVSDAGLVLDQLREKTTDALQRKDETGSMEIKMYDGMDISFCAIHTTTLECHWAGANNPLYVSTNNPDPTLSPVAEGLYMLEADSQPIGPHPAAKPFTNRVLQLHSGDVLYLMSDGFPDQFGGPNGRKFMTKNLRNLIAANAEKPLPVQKEALENALNEWMNYNGQVHAQTDDITLMAVKMQG